MILQANVSPECLSSLEAIVNQNIKFLESQILLDDNEEDIEYKEGKIRQLQREWSDFKMNCGKMERSFRMLKIETEEA